MASKENTREFIELLANCFLYLDQRIQRIQPPQPHDHDDVMHLARSLRSFANKFAPK